jgi:hypothetical protein
LIAMHLLLRPLLQAKSIIDESKDLLPDRIDS